MSREMLIHHIVAVLVQGAIGFLLHSLLIFAFEELSLHLRVPVGLGLDLLDLVGRGLGLDFASVAHDDVLGAGVVWVGWISDAGTTVDLVEEVVRNQIFESNLLHSVRCSRKNLPSWSKSNCGCCDGACSLMRRCAALDLSSRKFELARGEVASPKRAVFFAVMSSSWSAIGADRLLVLVVLESFVVSIGMDMMAMLWSTVDGA